SLAPPAPVLATADAGWAVPGVFENQPPPGRPGPSADVTALGRAVDRLAATDVSVLAPEQALSDLAELLRVDEVLRVARLARLTDAHTRKLAHLDDEASVQTWARHRFDDVPRTDIATAELLRPYVHLRGRVQAHQVTVEAAGLVGRALKKLRPYLDRDSGLIDGQPADEVIEAVVGNIVPLISGARLGLKDDDPLLLELRGKVSEILAAPDSELGKLELAFTLMAQHIPLRYLKHTLAEQVDALLPTELEEKSEKSRASRNLRIDTTDGGGRISVQATEELMELTETILGAEVRKDPENAADTGAKRELRERSLHGDILDLEDLEAAGDVRFPRTRGQRLHDALLLVLQRYLAAGLAGSHDKAPVAITVTVPVENLEKRPGALPAKSGSGRRLPASLVSRWWCDASVTALVLSEGLIPLGITHEMRTLTAAERKASKIQHSHGCSGLRCCTPHDPLVTLVPHHVRSFAKFGKTSIEDTIWACPRLHDAIHRGKSVPLRNGRWLNAAGYTDQPPVIDY
ncbi:MAG: DUF222 domain-containing protein, partial [Mycobacteriales bacterium]